MNSKVSELETYKTVNVLIMAFLIIFVLSREVIFLILSIFLGINNLFFIGVNKIIADYWLAFAKVLGSINSKIILTIVFYVFLTPISFLYRIFNSESVEKFKTDNKESYFEYVNNNYQRETFTKQW